MIKHKTVPSLGYFTPPILKVNIFPLNHSTVRITLYFGMLWKIIHSKVLGLKFPPFHLNPIKFWEREREKCFNLVSTNFCQFCLLPKKLCYLFSILILRICTFVIPFLWDRERMGSFGEPLNPVIFGKNFNSGIYLIQKKKKIFAWSQLHHYC